jgi:hypothetical protein
MLVRSVTPGQGSTCRGVCARCRLVRDHTAAMPTRCEDGSSCPRCPKRRTNSVSFPQYAETIPMLFSVGILGILGKTSVFPVKTAFFNCPKTCPRCPTFSAVEAFPIHVGAPMNIAKASHADWYPAGPVSRPGAWGAGYRLNVAHCSS